MYKRKVQGQGLFLYIFFNFFGQGQSYKYKKLGTYDPDQEKFKRKYRNVP
jgi:hypothetical protein